MLKISHILVFSTALLSVQQVNAYSYKDRPNYRNHWFFPPNEGLHDDLHHYGHESNHSTPQQNVYQANSTFEQLIDHENPGLGTFPQFYYYTTEFYKGPGSPVIFFTPGEVNATGYYSYLHENRTTGVVAKELGAAVIVLEHRYWGTSTPYSDLTDENLQYLTLKNSISDLNYFAKHAHLPFDPHGKSHPTKAPWIMMGGSYSGCLSAWTESTDSGTMWAYHSSSAPVQAIGDYWAYFLPVQQGMPKNCSKDISLVIDHVDNVGMNGTEEDQYSLKAMFNLQDVEHFDDFAAALENGPWLWQGNQFYSNSGFFEFCDAVENVNASTNSSSSTYPNTTSPDASGVGLEKALRGYATWFNTTFLPGYCESFGYWEGEYNTDCFDTYNASNPFFTDRSLTNTFNRQWNWMLCNEPFGYWQNGAPADRPSIVSRLVDNAYWVRQCELFFPDKTYGLAQGKTYQDVNEYTGGWYIDNTTRLIYVNGDYDPWREASVSSDLRPEGKLESTEKVPVNIVPGGFHTSDLVTMNGQVNEEVGEVINATVAQIVKWANEFPGGKTFVGGRT